MRRKSIVFALVSAAFMLLLLSCGGTPTPLTPEETLTKRAESSSLTTSREDWLELYKYLSLRTREVCKNGEYAVAMVMKIGMVKGLIGLPEDAKLTFPVLRVTVDGDIGRVYSGLKHDGDVIEFGEGQVEDVGERWVYVDGEWWHEEDDWETTCDFL